MSIEGTPEGQTQEEENEKRASRTLSDAELVKDGATYSGVRLNISPEQLSLLAKTPKYSEIYDYLDGGVQASNKSMDSVALPFVIEALNKGGRNPEKESLAYEYEEQRSELRRLWAVLEDFLNEDLNKETEMEDIDEYAVGSLGEWYVKMKEHETKMKETVDKIKVELES